MALNNQLNSDHPPIEFRMPSSGAVAVVVGQDNSTWFERLLMNLLSYCIVILPIAFIVIATRFKLFPRSIQANALIQWFVYGTNIGEDRDLTTSGRKGEAEENDEKLLLDRKANKAQTQQQQQATTTSSAFEFLWCLLGLQVSYLIWGLLQEKIMTTDYEITTMVVHGPDLNNHIDSRHSNLSGSSYLHDDSTSKTVKFHDSQFLVFINRLVAFITAILALVYTRRRQSRIYANRYTNGSRSAMHLSRTPLSGSTNTKPKAPLYKYIYCSLSNILSSWCQYEALKYVKFPTQCLSKSCKVIPVMLMSKVLLRKRYPFVDYFCALLLGLGMFIFMLNQPVNKHDNNDKHGPATVTTTTDKLISNSALISGVIILSLYLMLDSFTSNWQQSLYGRYDISNWQMMAAINFYSILLTLTSLHQLGSLRPAFNLLASSSSLLRDCLIMSFMSSIGQMFVYYTIKRFGSVLFAVIMTLRQFLSILMSCTIYKHRINFGSCLGLALVFLVVGFQVWHKSSRTKGSSKRAAAPEGQHSGGNHNPFNTGDNNNNGSFKNVCIEFKK